MSPWGRSWPGCIGVPSGANASCGPIPRRLASSSGGQSDDREPRCDRVLGGGAATVGVPGPGRFPPGAGEDRAAPVVLPPLLRELEFAKELRGLLGTRGAEELPPHVKARLERFLADL